MRGGELSQPIGQELWHAFMELVDSSPLATMRAQHMTEAEFLRHAMRPRAHCAVLAGH